MIEYLGETKIMWQILYIGIGGFLGSIFRFWVSKYANPIFAPFPLGTLIVNVTGSFLIAFISYSVLFGKSVPSDLRSFSTVGFIGAYTTMSTFAFESFRFMELKDYAMFGLNLLANVILCLIAIYLGRQAAILTFK